MSEANHQPAPDILDRATLALRQTTVSDTPPRQFVAETVQALESRMKQGFISPDVVRLKHERRQRMFRIARYSGSVAALLLLVLGTGVVLLLDHSATPAFGQVIENVKKTTSVSFMSKQKFGPQPTLEMKFYLQGDFMRAEMPGKQAAFDAKIPLAMATVANLHTKEIVQVNYTNNTAQKYPMNEETKKQFLNPVEAISQLAEKDAKRIGEENLNGRKTVVYRLARLNSWIGSGKIGEGDSVKVWTDSQTDLPVQMVMELSNNGKNKTSIELSDFVWNKPLSADLFKLEIPEGFKVSDKPLGPEPPESK